MQPTDQNWEPEMNRNQIGHLHVIIWIQTLCFNSSFLIIFAKVTSEGDIRLVGGSSRLQGRLEIYHNYIWGTVCSDGFGYNDASVVCRQLGSSSWTNVKFYTSGDGMGQISLTDLACGGNESALINCGYSSSTFLNCNHDKDVGVWCFDASEGDLRLIGGEDYGRLEIYHSNSWGSICEDGFTKNNAIVACRQMKLRSTHAGFYTAPNGVGIIWLDDVHCTKKTNGIDMCRHTEWGIHDCSHGEDVGVRCLGGYDIFQGDLRLVGGTSPRDGRLELYYNYQWRTICGDQFDVIDARVACRQLRYSTDAVEIYTATGASSNASIWKGDFNCSASDTRLINCRRQIRNRNNCSHAEDVGIKCFGKYVESGNWGEWSVWDSCRPSCGLGHQTRRRRCNSPIPSAGGRDCNGQNSQWQRCKLAVCQVDGEWSKWSSWNTCSATCNGGIQDRTRTCDNPTPSDGGRYCYERSIESRLCNIIGCEIHGQWGSWQEWESCNTTCEHGFKNRSRDCDSPSPMFGGSDCIGLAVQNCSQDKCLVHGQWGSWQEWGSCNTTCGNGFQNRLRRCDSPSPVFGGSDCIGNNFNIQNCIQDICQGTERALTEEASKQFSAGILAAVAVGCSVVTAVIIFLGHCAFRRLNPIQTAKQNKKAGNNRRLGELPLPSQINDYERSRRSSDTQSGVYDSIEIDGRANSQMNSNNEEVYEDLKL
ncbi:uncharacterized protein [Mytilus edulis]|uniref:uncharacterized protein n=1 Tax=Mytilus edulis TaxID=6550 RepID=UPI0039EFA3F6